METKTNFDLSTALAAWRQELLAQDSGPMEFPYEIFPESETEFFPTAVDAQISFVKDEAGIVTAAVLHQNGKNLKAKKEN